MVLGLPDHPGGDQDGVGEQEGRPKAEGAVVDRLRLMVAVLDEDKQRSQGGGL